MKEKLFELRKTLDTILNFGGDLEYQDLRYVLSQVESCTDPRIEILKWMLKNEPDRGLNDIQPLLDKIAGERTWLRAYELAGDHRSLVKYLDSDDQMVRDQAISSLTALTALGEQVVEPLREEFIRRKSESETTGALSQCIACKTRIDEKLRSFALSVVDVVNSVDIESVSTPFLIELFEYFDGGNSDVIVLLTKKDDVAVVKLFKKACEDEYDFDMADYLWMHGVYRFVRKIIKNDADDISPPETDGQIECLIDILENYKYESDTNFGYDIADTDWGDTIIDMLLSAVCSPELESKIDAALMYRAGTDDVFSQHAFDALLERNATPEINEFLDDLMRSESDFKYEAFDAILGGLEEDSIDRFLLEIMDYDSDLWDKAYKVLLKRNKVNLLLEKLHGTKDDCLFALDVIQEFRIQDALPELQKISKHPDHDIKTSVKATIKILRIPDKVHKT